MESEQQQTRPEAPGVLADGDDTSFHPSKRVRGFLGVGVVFYTIAMCIAGLSFAFADQYSYNSRQFILEISRFVVVLFLCLFLYISVIWFLAIYYNKSIPTHKYFLIGQLVCSVPALLVAVALIVAFIGEAISSFSWWAGDLPPRWLVVFWASATIPFLFAVGITLWALFWTFRYFIKARREELQELLGIGKKKKAQDDGEGSETGHDMDTLMSGTESEQETPLLIDHAQMV
ncbi:hypothetical protein DRE_02778 [Drechslerella stenobrocha 248]|uniref:Uncharacterized protein n=1 Tax=Drechslerella stenobrocha 248 TaxID=1043628 RepID=W7HUL0_9PEZI|nr:hypothetical protein DRE_02778 [Drechslerella stenobrocha 248]